jgi:quinol monooxygenase YgiN
MALALMYDLPEMTRPRYGGAMRTVNFDRRRPPELKVHVAWEKEEGGWRIFEVWESYEAWKPFFDEKYLQALRGRGREFQLEILSNDVQDIYTD